jgi:hypothetical protein
MFWMTGRTWRLWVQNIKMMIPTPKKRYGYPSGQKERQPAFKTSFFFEAARFYQLFQNPMLS